MPVVYATATKNMAAAAALGTDAGAGAGDKLWKLLNRLRVWY
jgi:hypothetical protein